MPVILNGGDAEAAWLDRDVDLGGALELVRPLPAGIVDGRAATHGLALTATTISIWAQIRRGSEGFARPNHARNRQLRMPGAATSVKRAGRRPRAELPAVSRPTAACA
jgi:hypothetical protein